MTEMLPKKSYEAGETIFKENDAADALYVIYSGKVEISKGQGDLKQVLAELGKDSIFGDMALIDDKPRSATVTALEPTECFIISTDMFKQRIASLDPLMQSIFQILTGRLRMMNEKMAKLAA